MATQSLDINQPEVSIDHEEEPEQAQIDLGNSPDAEIITGSHSLESPPSNTVSLSTKLSSNDIQTTEADIDLEDETDNITDVILMAMLHELDMELFPPRHLFLLTADLSGIELEHA